MIKILVVTVVLLVATAPAAALDLEIGNCTRAKGSINPNADTTVVDCNSAEAESQVMDIISRDVKHGFTRCVEQGYGHMSQIGANNPTYCMKQLKNKRNLETKRTK